MNIKDKENRKESFVGFRAEDSLKNEIEMRALTKGISISTLLRKAVEEYLNKKGE